MQVERNCVHLSPQYSHIHRLPLTETAFLENCVPSRKEKNKNYFFLEAPFPALIYRNGVKIIFLFSLKNKNWWKILLILNSAGLKFTIPISHSHFNENNINCDQAYLCSVNLDFNSMLKNLWRSMNILLHSYFSNTKIWGQLFFIFKWHWCIFFYWNITIQDFCEQTVIVLSQQPDLNSYKYLIGWFENKRAIWVSQKTLEGGWPVKGAYVTCRMFRYGSIAMVYAMVV